MKIFSLLAFLFITTTSYGTILSGNISDDKNKPLAFASVFIKGTTNGVTANVEGNYTLQLAPGNYEIVFQYVGYMKTTKSVTVGSTPITLNVNLQPENFKLKEVVINADAEDPAYRVIRNAQKKRKHYLEQVEEFKCKVYIKGV